VIMLGYILSGPFYTVWLRKKAAKAGSSTKDRVDPNVAKAEGAADARRQG
jgi:hypothetical protein